MALAQESHAHGYFVVIGLLINEIFTFIYNVGDIF